MKIDRFVDGGTSHETWELPDAGWDDWVTTLDRFLAHAIQGIATAYAADPVEWLEINHWQDSGRLIVFPSQDGPTGDREERVCFELSSEYLASENGRIADSVEEETQEEEFESLAARVWTQVSHCLLQGKAAEELAKARGSLAMKIVGYDYNPGEGPIRLNENGDLA